MPTLPPDIVQIRIPTPFDMGAANVWLLKGAVPTLIDMGIDWQDSFPRLERQLRAADVAVEDIAHVLCTHGHEDHIGLAAAFMERNEIPLFLHSGDQIKLTDNRPGPPWMIHAADEMYALYAVSGVPDDVIRPMKQFGFAAFHESMGIGCRSYAHPCPLGEGQRFPAGSRLLTVIETPGHSPGQVCFLDETDGLLFCGDQVLDRISPNPIIEHLNGARFKALPTYVRSLRRVERLGVRCTCAGHGPPIWDTDRVIREYFDLFVVRREMAFKFVKKQMCTAYEITRHVYKHADDWGFFPAFNAALGLLDVLEEDGRVAQVPGEDGRVYWRAQEAA